MLGPVTSFPSYEPPPTGILHYQGRDLVVTLDHIKFDMTIGDPVTRFHCDGLVTAIIGELADPAAVITNSPDLMGKQYELE